MGIEPGNDDGGVLKMKGDLRYIQGVVVLIIEFPEGLFKGGADLMAGLRKFQPTPTSGIQEFYTLGNAEIEIQIQYDIGFFAFPVIIEMDFRLGKKILFDDLEEFIQSVRGLKYNCPAQLPIGIGFLWECH